MALRNLIQQGVDAAFEAVGDLAVDVTFTAGTPGAYNFSTNSTTVTEASSITVKGIITETTVYSDRDRTTNVMLVKKSDVGDVNVYDTFSAGGKSYRVQVVADNGFTVELSLSGGTNG